MQLVPALAWAQVGSELLASVSLDFSIDLAWRVTLGGSIGRDYFDARAVEINGYQLAAADLLQALFNGQTRRVAPGAVHIYQVPPYQTVLDFTATNNTSRAELTFYTYAKPEWR